jgi:hypothetical protein
MYIPKPNESSEFANAPAGTHLALCYRFIDLGTQETNFLDSAGNKKMAHKVLIGWELPDELMDNGKPFVVQQRYTWSMSDKANLRKDLESWRGKSFEDKDFGPGGFNVKNVLGKPCVLTIVHKEDGGKVYANIASVGKPMKGMQAPAAPQNPVVYFSLDEFDASVYATLSQGLQAVIAKSPEFQKISGGHHDEPPVSGPVDDFAQDVPF